MSGLALVARALGADGDRLRPLRRLLLRGALRDGRDRARRRPRRRERARRAPRSSSRARSRPRTPSARRRRDRELHRADLLGELTRLRPTIAVTGTHGKTTTVEHARPRAARLRAWTPATSSAARCARPAPTPAGGRGSGWSSRPTSPTARCSSSRRRVAVLTNAELDHHATYSSQRDVDDDVPRLPRPGRARGRLGRPALLALRRRRLPALAVRRRARADARRLALRARRRRGRADRAGRPQRAATPRRR